MSSNATAQDQLAQNYPNISLILSAQNNLQYDEYLRMAVQYSFETIFTLPKATFTVPLSLNRSIGVPTFTAGMNFSMCSATMLQNKIFYMFLKNAQICLPPMFMW